MTTRTAAVQERHEDLALERLLEAVFDTYHYDFRSYARSSLRRRVEHARCSLRYPTIPSLTEGIIRDPRLFEKFLGFLTIQVSNLFRDPNHWRVLREFVVPHLATYPFVRVWVAGCGLGEEAYAMAILLAEEGLLDRTQIYATDISSASLECAASGRYDLDRMRSFSINYLQAGGKGSLADFYVTTRSCATFSPQLRDRILFSDHSLASDVAFAEVQLVSCRNVLIYFDRTLQDRVLGLFADALCPRGFLGLGNKETLIFSARAKAFAPLVPQERIYRKQEHA